MNEFKEGGSLKRRNAGVELWRCVCMLAIVFFHVFRSNNVCGMEFLSWHVPGFLIISGFFGVNLSFKKLIKLLLIVYSCYWISFPLHLQSFSILTALLPHGGWFFPFYVSLVILSPLFNAAFKDRPSHRLIFASMILILTWGLIVTLSTNQHVAIAKTDMMTHGNGFLLMLGTYGFGRLAYYHDVPNKLKIRSWMLLFLIGLGWCFVQYKIGLGLAYCSLPCLFTAFSGFALFYRLERNLKPMAKTINFIAPSMFSVYILHECSFRQLQYVMGGGGFGGPKGLRVIRPLHCY